MTSETVPKINMLDEFIPPDQRPMYREARLNLHHLLEEQQPTRSNPMITDANPNTPNTSVYIVYAEATEDHSGRIFHTTCDLSQARSIAQGCAKEYPHDEIHIATRISTFKAETVVKER